MLSMAALQMYKYKNWNVFLLQTKMNFHHFASLFSCTLTSSHLCLVSNVNYFFQNKVLFFQKLL